MGYALSGKARNDLREIAVYVATESGSLAIAEKVVDLLTRRFELLAERPYIGPARDDLKLGVRGFPVDRYMVVYRVMGKQVRILRVAHTRRDLVALMKT